MNGNVELNPHLPCWTPAPTHYRQLYARTHVPNLLRLLSHSPSCSSVLVFCIRSNRIDSMHCVRLVQYIRTKERIASHDTMHGAASFTFWCVMMLWNLILLILILSSGGYDYVWWMVFMVSLGPPPADSGGGKADENVTWQLRSERNIKIRQMAIKVRCKMTNEQWRAITGEGTARGTAVSEWFPNEAKQFTGRQMSCETRD